MKQVLKFRAHSTLGVSGAFRDQATFPPKRITTASEIESRSALFIIQGSCARVEAIVGKMRKFCRLPGMDSFFNAYATYKDIVANLLDQANMILPKLSPSFRKPSYLISEELRHGHDAFLGAVTHMNLAKQALYNEAICNHLSALPSAFDRFIAKYRRIPLVKLLLAQFKPQFRESLEHTSRELRAMRVPIEFERLDFDKVTAIGHRLRRLNRIFDTGLISAVKDRAPGQQVPLAKNTEWHGAMISLIPIVSDLPLFLECRDDLGQEIPNLTVGINALCVEIEDLILRKSELQALIQFSDGVEQLDTFVKRASALLNLDSDKLGPNPLERICDSAEATVSTLRKQLQQCKEEAEKLGRIYERRLIGERFKRVRESTNGVAKRYESEKEHFVFLVVGKLKQLISKQFSEHDGNPIRQFNFIYAQLVKEISDLRVRAGDPPVEDPVMKIVNENFRNFVVSCCQQLSPDDVFLNELSELESRIKLTELIGQKVSECEGYKNSMRAVCAKLNQPVGSGASPEQMRELAFNGIDAPDGLNVDRIMASLQPQEIAVDLRTAERLAMIDRTGAAIESFDSLIAKMTKLLDRRYAAFLPTSKYFSAFLDCLSGLKGLMQKLDPEKIFRPVYSLPLKCVELFNALAIPLSAASFAPEYSANHQVVAALLEAQQAADQSIARLRILLEERDQLLMGETEKLQKLEKAYASYTASHPSKS
jgi:hypothetical protein